MSEVPLLSMQGPGFSGRGCTHYLRVLEVELPEFGESVVEHVPEHAIRRHLPIAAIVSSTSFNFDQYRLTNIFRPQPAVENLQIGKVRVVKRPLDT